MANKLIKYANFRFCQTHTQAAAIIIRIKNMRKKQRFATSWEPVHLPGVQILTPN